MAGIAVLAGPIAFGSLSATASYAQDSAHPIFEVASVKPTTRRSGIRLDGTAFKATNSALGFIVMAYGLSSCATKVATGLDCPLISGTLPAWTKSVFPVTTNLFEIRARLPENSGIVSSYTTEQVFEGRVAPLNLMLQALLADRFHLKVHREMKELPVYILTAGKSGPKLKQTTVPKQVTAADGTSVEHHGVSAFEPVLSPDGSRTGRRRIIFQGSSIQQAADILTSYLDRPILDRTGLKGEYDFKIEYEVDPDATKQGGTFMAALMSGLTCAELSRSLDEAGLKCESAKGPVQILVIDNVEQPSEN